MSENLKVNTAALEDLTEDQAKAFKVILEEASKSEYMSADEKVNIPKIPCVVILSEKDQPIGFYTPKKQEFNGKDYWRAGALFLSAKERGKGIMHNTLMEFFDAHKPGLAWIDDANKKSIALFKSLDFDEGEVKKDGSIAGHWWTKEAKDKKLSTESFGIKAKPIYSHW
jgi:L-amino acid N-acyltransferase YncA